MASNFLKANAALEANRTYEHINVFAPSAGRTAGLKADRLAGLWGKNTEGKGKKMLEEAQAKDADEDALYGVLPCGGARRSKKPGLL